MKTLWALAILFLCSACESTAPPQTPPWSRIAGRDPAVTQPIYRARIPPTWQRVDSPQTNDTTKPLGRFLIQDPAGEVEITFHNFPTEAIEPRIPSEAQIARWQRQQAEPGSQIPVAHGGFVGLALETDGLLAWSLQLAPCHYRTLSNPPDSRLKQQMRADYTIKATGPHAALVQHREAIIAFARSMELIEEIP